MANRPTVLVDRHPLWVRMTHWLNVISLWLLLMSGLQIFNAHPALYWGEASRFGSPWLATTAQAGPGGALQGLTQLGPFTFTTTGVLGASVYRDRMVRRGFPAWATLPAAQNLAFARRWHFFFAWVFAINGVIYLATALIGGRLRRTLAPNRDQLKPSHILHDIAEHIRLRFPKGEEARRYNVLQKLTYLTMILVVLPVAVLTGLTMSPSLDATFPFLLDLFGGRQSARSIHFICAALIVAFVIVHVTLVILSGFWNNMRSMITGRYAIETETAPEARS